MIEKCIEDIKFKYKILNPGGNKTALVEGLDFSKEERVKVNNIILEDNKDVEQVGFIDRSKRKLEMAGGEFCMNATRCAIYEFLEKKGVAVWIRKTENPNEAVKELLENPEQIKHMKIRSKLMAKKNSTRDICKIIMDDKN